MEEMEIGVLGGTGPAGSGLAARLASLGHTVLIGSREAARAAEIVDRLRRQWGERVAGLDPVENIEAATRAEVVVLAVPWEAAARTALEHAHQCDGKVVISMANALRRKGREFEAVLSPRRSIAAEVQAAMPGARVVSAFQHVAASAFGQLDEPIRGDVIMCSDHEDALELVGGIVASVPVLRPFVGGSLKNSMGVEAFAAVLLSVNLRYRKKAGLQLTGVDPAPTAAAGASP